MINGGTALPSARAGASVSRGVSTSLISCTAAREIFAPAPASITQKRTFAPGAASRPTVTVNDNSTGPSSNRNRSPSALATEIERPAFESFLVVDQHQWRLSELRRPAWPWWGALVDTHAVRAAFDAQIRRNTRAGERGAVVEADAGVLRWLAPGTQTSCITWSELTSDSADAVIAAQVRYFAARGTPVEWKLYDYDQPADLAQRLLAAGFVADDEELMLVAETAGIDSDVKLPDGVRLDPVTDQAGVEAMMAVHDLAFTGHPSPELGERLVTQLREVPELVQMVVARAGDEPVSAARVEFIPGTDFAGLWGGGTVPAWRGRGIFRALVAYRAGLAAARGYRYLQVDALPASLPILQRLGFKPVAATTPYVWTPPGQ